MSLPCSDGGVEGEHLLHLAGAELERVGGPFPLGLITHDLPLLPHACAAPARHIEQLQHLLVQNKALGAKRHGTLMHFLSRVIRCPFTT